MPCGETTANCACDRSSQGMSSVETSYRRMWRTLACRILVFAAASLAPAHITEAADCARLVGCGSSSQTNALIRKFNYGVLWSTNPVPNSPYVLFDSPRFRELNQSA